MYHMRSLCNQTTYPIAVAVKGTTWLHILWIQSYNRHKMYRVCGTNLYSHTSWISLNIWFKKSLFCKFLQMATQRFKALPITIIKIYLKTHKPNLIVLYGCETWVMTEQIKSSLKTCEQKILRKTYDPVKNQNGWRMWTNEELQVM